MDVEQLVKKGACCAQPIIRSTKKKTSSILVCPSGMRPDAFPSFRSHGSPPRLSSYTWTLCQSVWWGGFYFYFLTTSSTLRGFENVANVTIILTRKWGKEKPSSAILEEEQNWIGTIGLQSAVGMISLNWRVKGSTLFLLYWHAFLFFFPAGIQQTTDSVGRWWKAAMRATLFFSLLFFWWSDFPLFFAHPRSSVQRLNNFALSLSLFLECSMKPGPRSIQQQRKWLIPLLFFFFFVLPPHRRASKEEEERRWSCTISFWIDGAAGIASSSPGKRQSIESLLASSEKKK